MVNRHFKMEDINQVKDIIQQGDWLIKIDLKDAYFTIPIYNADKLYLRFPWEENIYQFLCLPCSSLGFHKVDEGPNKLCSPTRVKNGSLLGRHTSIEQDKGRFSVRWHKSERDSAKFGVHDKFQEINIHTCSSNRISRIQNRFYDNETLSTTEKG